MSHNGYNNNHNDDDDDNNANAEIVGPVTIDCDTDADLRAPQDGNEMADPNAHGLFDGEQVLNDPRFKDVIARIDEDGVSDNFSAEALERRRREREEQMMRDPDARAANEQRMRDADKMPDIISYGFCKLVFDFLEALRKRFPKRQLLARTIDYYWRLCERCPMMPYQKFEELVRNCKAEKQRLVDLRKEDARQKGKRYTAEKDEDVFAERTPENEEIIKRELMKNPVFKMAKIHLMWRAETDEDTKIKIWNYVNRLVQVTTLIGQFDPRLRNLINAVSMDSLNAVKGKNKSQIDVGELLEELQERILGDEELLDSIVDLAQKQM